MAGLRGNAIVAQSGGPTAVINASACGVIQEALKRPEIEHVYAAHNGILGVLNEEIYDLGREDPDQIEGLKSSPASALGSCRYKVRSEEDFARIVNVFKKHNIRYFFYIGGNDSMDTADQVNKLAAKMGYEFVAMGVPKTIDNDLAHTDHTPGYGSVIKYLATMVMEAGRDTEALYTTDTVNVIEAMGRNAGWIAAGTALARRNDEDAPHIILLPEVPFDKEKFKARGAALPGYHPSLRYRRLRRNQEQRRQLYCRAERRFRERLLRSHPARRGGSVYQVPYRG